MGWQYRGRCAALHPFDIMKYFKFSYRFSFLLFSVDSNIEIIQEIILKEICFRLDIRYVVLLSAVFFFLLSTFHYMYLQVFILFIEENIMLKYLFRFFFIKFRKQTVYFYYFSNSVEKGSYIYYLTSAVMKTSRKTCLIDILNTRYIAKFAYSS